MKATAVLSDDGVYRYRLGRVWDPTLPTMAFVMLNPSTADATIDDPTIRRCLGFAQREECGAIDVVNLFAYRAAKPRDLFDAAARVDVIGPDNEAHIANMLDTADVVVAAWGATSHAPVLRRRVPISVVTLAAEATVTLYCLGRTLGGYPRHPLYLRTEQPLEVF